MADYSPACHAPKKLGLIDVKVAIPFTGTLLQLGHFVDNVEIHERDYVHDVHGDRNGGHEGPPIESQILGRIVSVSGVMSSWNASNMATYLNNGSFATPWTILQSEVGQFLLTTKSMRLLLHTTDANDTRNFWCAIAREPIRMGGGTMHTEYFVSWECHRAPCGHAKANILWDTNSDAYS